LPRRRPPSPQLAGCGSRLAYQETETAGMRANPRAIADSVLQCHDFPVWETAEPTMLAYDDKLEAVKQWTLDPCGAASAAGLEIGSREFYERIDHHRYEEHVPWMRTRLEFDRHAGERVLEVGFGLGTDLFQFASSGAIVSGIDLSPVHVRIARRRFELYGLNAHLLMGDAESLPFSDGSFDVVYTFGVLHHTSDARRAVREVHRVLRPKGHLILGVYHRYSAFFLCSVLLESYLLAGRFLQESFRRTLSRIEYRENSDACPLVRLYSRRTLRSLLHGFRRVEIECIHLDRGHFARFARFVSPERLRRFAANGWLGWYLIAKCVK